MVVSCENSTDNILIKFQAKRQIDLLCNAGTTVSWIAPFHLDDGGDEGPFGPALRPPRGEYSSRYFRFFSTVWNLSRVEGFMIMAERAIRRGLKNNVQNPSRALSRTDRLGARCLDLLWTISCCFRRRFSAMMARLPPGLSSVAMVV